MIPEYKIIAVQQQLRAAGRPATYYDAVRELGRRGGNAAARRRRQRMANNPATGRAILPPGDRD